MSTEALNHFIIEAQRALDRCTPVIVTPTNPWCAIKKYTVTSQDHQILRNSLANIVAEVEKIEKHHREEIEELEEMLDE